MFTDMVDFTALIQEDERRANSIRDRHRDALRVSIERHGGEIVQFYGDGTLSVFDSAIGGVNAAVEAQRRLREGEPMPVRVGIHIGDINHYEDGVYGDGVNVASRIQDLSVPGAVLVSGKVRSAERCRNPMGPLRFSHDRSHRPKYSHEWRRAFRSDPRALDQHPVVKDEDALQPHPATQGRVVQRGKDDLGALIDHEGHLHQNS